MSKFETICNVVREKVTNNEWPPGHKLPSQKQWEDSALLPFRVSYGSLRGAYLVLKAEGWIVGQQGDGVYVAQEPPIPKKSPTKK